MWGLGTGLHGAYPRLRFGGLRSASESHRRLALGPEHPDFAQYLYWLHLANGNLQPNMGRNMMLRRLDLAPDNPTLVLTRGRLARLLDQVETRLGETAHLAGQEFTAADIMTVFSLTTMRIFMLLDLSSYLHIRAYLGRIGEREAYRRPMQKGDPDMAPLLS